MNVTETRRRKEYLKWKEKGMPLPDITKKNAETIKTFLFDMEIGRNVSIHSKKGSRSYQRLITLKSKLSSLTKIIEKEYNKTHLLDLESKELQLLELFAKLRNGEIISQKGKPYQNVGVLVKILKTFWSWHMKVMKKQGKRIINITEDLDSSQSKPKWNYITEKDLERLCNHTNLYYRTLLCIIFYTGIRSPSELWSIQRKHFRWEEKEGIYYMTIPETKTGVIREARCLKAHRLTELLNNYFKEYNIGDIDYLFTKQPNTINKNIKKLGYKVLNIGTIEKGCDNIKSGLTMYDLRHNSCCFWLNEGMEFSDIMIRFGWKKADKIHYYSEWRGLADKSNEFNMIDTTSKYEMEKKYDEQQNRISLLQEKMDIMTKKQRKETIGLISELLGDLVDDQKLFDLQKKFKDMM